VLTHAPRQPLRRLIFDVWQNKPMKIPAILAVAALAAAAAASEAPVVLPEVNVQASRPGRFNTRGIVGGDGVVRVFVTPARSPARDSTFLYGDFRVGDEIVQVDGRDAQSLPQRELSSHLHAGAKVVVRRRVALQRFDLVEVECRRAEPIKPNKAPATAPVGVTPPVPPEPRRP
jgi:hypothetical protein